MYDLFKFMEYFSCAIFIESGTYNQSTCPKNAVATVEKNNLRRIKNFPNLKTESFIAIVLLFSSMIKGTDLYWIEEYIRQE